MKVARVLPRQRCRVQVAGVAGGELNWLSRSRLVDEQRSPLSEAAIWMLPKLAAGAQVCLRPLADVVFVDLDS